MNVNLSNVDDNNRLFVTKSVTRDLSNGNSEYCRRGYSNHQHRANHVGYCFDVLYGKPVVPAYTRSNCDVFQRHRIFKEYEA